EDLEELTKISSPTSTTEDIGNTSQTVNTQQEIDDSNSHSDSSSSINSDLPQPPQHILHRHPPTQVIGDPQARLIDSFIYGNL
ncbi:hypothetical protein LINGRAHAP2_LOCUS2018, partial [Linum grandiflorum]